MLTCGARPAGANPTRQPHPERGSNRRLRGDRRSGPTSRSRASRVRVSRPVRRTPRARVRAVTRVGRRLHSLLGRTMRGPTGRRRCSRWMMRHGCCVGRDGGRDRVRRRGSGDSMYTEDRAPRQGLKRYPDRHPVARVVSVMIQRGSTFARDFLAAVRRRVFWPCGARLPTGKPGNARVERTA